MADRDGDEGAALGVRARIVRRSDGAQERERLEVDPDDLQAGLAAGVDVAVDELAVGDDEEHAPERLAVLGDALGEHLVVEHRLLERDRQHFLSPETDRVRELLRILDPGHLEGAHADPVVGDAEPDAALRQLVLGEEGLERNRERLGVTKLAVDDDAVVERRARRLDELGRLAVADAGRGDLGAADLEADELLAAAAAAARQGRQRRQGQAQPRRARQLELLRRRFLGQALAGVPLLRAALERKVALVERRLAAGVGGGLLLLLALGLRRLRLFRLLGRLRATGSHLERDLLLVERHLRRRLLRDLGGLEDGLRLRLGRKRRQDRRRQLEVEVELRLERCHRLRLGLLLRHGRDRDQGNGRRHERDRRDGLGGRVGDLLERLGQPVVLDSRERRCDRIGLDGHRLGRKRQRRDRDVEVGLGRSRHLGHVGHHRRKLGLVLRVLLAERDLLLPDRARAGLFRRLCGIVLRLAPERDLLLPDRGGLLVVRHLSSLRP